MRWPWKSNPKPKEHKAIGLRTGEAAWVSFSRVIHYSCHQDVRYDLVERDVDRCPVDLPTVPMPLSLRDVVVMALSVGMQCTEASFVGKSLSMQGSAGVLATSQHPVLGPLLHFTPGDTSVLHGITRLGFISQDWISRSWDWCIVAGETFQHRDRKSVEKIAGVWIHRVRSSGTKSHNVVPIARGEDTKEAEKRRRRQTAVRVDSNKAATSTQVAELTPLGQRKGVHDGEWELRIHENHRFRLPVPSWMPGATGPSPGAIPVGIPIPMPSSDTTDDSAGQTEKTTATFKVPSRHNTLQATVEDASNSNSEVHLPLGGSSEGKKETSDEPAGSSQQPTDPYLMAPRFEHHAQIDGAFSSTSEVEREAKQRQAERNERAAKIAKDEEMVDTLEKTGRTQTVSGMRLLEWRKDVADGPSDFLEDPESSKEKTITPEEQEALDREAKRKKEREERDRQRHLRNDERNRAAATYGRINWFWLSQTDIIPGFWATPWRSFEGVDEQICLGAIKIILNALLGFTDNNSLRYVMDGLEGLQRSGDVMDARWQGFMARVRT